MPKRAASRPVKKGRRADPTCPRPVMRPRAKLSNPLGRIFEEWLTRMGYIGPSIIPINDTATAFSISEGTTQMVISSL